MHKLQLHVSNSNSHVNEGPKSDIAMYNDKRLAPHFANKLLELVKITFIIKILT